MGSRVADGCQVYLTKLNEYVLNLKSLNRRTLVAAFEYLDFRPGHTISGVQEWFKTLRVVFDQKILCSCHFDLYPHQFISALSEKAVMLRMRRPQIDYT